MKILVLNCGSATVKFQVFEVNPLEERLQACRRLARGLVDRIGGRTLSKFFTAGSEPEESTRPVGNHEEAVGHILAWLGKKTDFDPKHLDGVGHRVVHGGDRFTSSVLINDEVILGIEGLSELAPLHNPVCLSGIHAARKILGDRCPMVAVFDTSFHHTLPDYASTYAIPFDLSQKRSIRRYGFHGLAHRYAALGYAEIAGVSDKEVNIITLHLGNGCSATAIRAGKSVDTSMGLTPLEGLVMGTRSGDLDPALISYLCRAEGLSVNQVEEILNHRSGVLGISGKSSDMRDLLAQMATDARARLAVDVFCYRVRKYLGSYLAALGGARAVVFSGGIGENSAIVRRKVCESMEWCGLRLDPGFNESFQGKEGKISSIDSRIEAYVIPSDEEVLIAKDTARVIQDRSDRSY